MVTALLKRAGWICVAGVVAGAFVAPIIVLSIVPMLREIFK